MSLAYAAPSTITPGAPSSAHAAFTWPGAPLLGTMASLMHFSNAALITDDIVARTWTKIGSGSPNGNTYRTPSGGQLPVSGFFPSLPVTSTELATDNGTGSALFVADVGVGGVTSILYSDYASGLNPGTDWTVEGFFANAQPYVGQAANFGSKNPTLWFFNDSDINGIGGSNYLLQRTDYPAQGGTIKFYVTVNNVTLLTLDTGCPFTAEHWWHIAVSRRGNQYQVFVDGELKDSGTAGGSGGYSGNAFIALGFTYKDLDTNPNYGGWMDEFRYTRGNTVYWDDTHGVPEHDLTGFAQAYVIYRDGVQIAVVDSLDGLSFVDTDVVSGQSYSYQVGAWDNVGLVSALSDPVLIGVIGRSDQTLIGFNDEQVFQGYLGGRLKGTTVACPGDNANEAKSCC